MDTKDNPIVEAIIEYVKADRYGKKKMEKSSYEVAADTIIIAEELVKNLEKYMIKNMQAPARRSRELYKILETLGKSFRLQTTKHVKN